MDINEIKKAIPHRYPFLLVDKITQIGENSIEAIKNLTINESFFQGHYPDFPIMPGVLQVEAMAQTGGILLYTKHPELVKENRTIFFMSIDGIKFRTPVVPGDQLRMVIEIQRFSNSKYVFSGKSYVEDKLASQVEKFVVLLKNNVEIR